ncbi:response regulator [Oscillatoria sp. FACHB-1406]|uniref:response regulator n=1 Tax=Oscillatoria sp. FACHB-1406 TaxID=2692846 RepID=UPI0016858AEC|nr:response regulator [Oscillatoria sp. FACHB-1406]MBD2579124.1 response regulator [Oscillatoria sp. FACHB-1406]
MQVEQRQKITGYFIEEAKEHLETIQEGIANFQSTLDDPETANEIYRAAHSIKGGAAMLELESIRRSAHRLEDFFKRLKEKPVKVDTRLQSLCTQIFNALQTLVGELERHLAVPAGVSERVMAEIEPIFEQTQYHIDSLLNPKIAVTAGNMTQENGSTVASVAIASSVQSDFPIAPSHSSRKLSSTPEVGEAELSTLADLFATSDLEDNLDEDNVTLIQFGEGNGRKNENFNDVLGQLDDFEDFDGAQIPEVSEDITDISGFLDQLGATNVSAANAKLSSVSESVEDDNDFDFLGDLASATSSQDLTIDSSLDDLFGPDVLLDEEPIEKIAAVLPSEEREDKAAVPEPEFSLDTMLQELGAAPGSIESSEPSISRFKEEIETADAQFDTLDTDFSLDTLFQGEADIDLSLDNIFDAEQSQDLSLDTLLQEQIEDLSLDTVFQEDSQDLSLDTLLQDLGSPSSESSQELSATFSQDLARRAASEEALELDRSLDASLDELLAESSRYYGEPFEVAPESSPSEIPLDDLLEAAVEPELAVERDPLSDLFDSVAPPAAVEEKPLEESFEDSRLGTISQDAPPKRSPIAPVEVDSRAPELHRSEPAVDRVSPVAARSEAELEQPEEQPATLTPFYYDAIEDLEALLDTEPPTEDNSIPFAELDRFLETKPELSPPEPELELELGLGLPATPAMEEDEFSDLIKLLEFDVPGTGQPTNLDRPSRPRRVSTVVEQTLKVPVKQMDNLNNLMGELVVNRNSLEGDGDKLRQSLDSLMHQVQNLSDVAGRMQDLYERSLLEDALLKSRQEYRGHNPVDRSAVYTSKSSTKSSTNEEKDGYSALEMDSFSKFHELAQETIELIVRVRESASDINLWVDDIDHVARSLRQVTSQLQEGLTKARMVPFSRTADRLPLAVKKICPQLSKEAQLYLEGKETLIDKMILEHLSDPLTHLVNNALTHGIELPDERISRGKRPEGQITVRALQQGNQTVISVSDDGAGIDAARVKQKALEKRLITQTEATRMTDLDVYELLFHAGFSTKDQADNFSGRGVGLDVVRTSIAEIRGSVNIDSELGKGTTFTIRLPLTLSISKALCCVSASTPLAFPMDGVEDMFDLPLTQIHATSDGYQYIQWRDIRLHFCMLSELLTYHRKLGRSNLYVSGREDNMVSVVVLRSATSFLAIGVEQLLGDREIVIKQIIGPVPKPAGIAGATVQGDGRIMAIADVLELIQIAEGRMRREARTLWQDPASEMNAQAERSQPMVLIVDDSITVRSLLSMTFEKAGYQVEQARDGQDAWEKLRSGLPCDIVFCDIEMPRLDGLELLGRLQKDEQLRLLPVAMLTSRGAERHRRVAADLGASGYFTKPYLEEVLLDAAERMVEGEVLLPGSTRKPGKKRFEESQTHHPTLQPPQVAPPVHTSPKVLIVDDSVTVRSLLAMTFEGAGYEVAQARDGQDAWNQLNAGLNPDVAFLDIEMPRMDGMQLLERLQDDENLKTIPVAMITSRGAQKMKQRAAERGACGYFTKPYVEQELLEAAKRLRNGEVLLPGSTRQPQVAPAQSQGNFSGIEATLPSVEVAPALVPIWGSQPVQHSILIVDDSITVRSLLAATFEGAGYLVAQARDGQDALNQLQAGLKADLLFLDIEMPRMDGITLLSNLQADENLKGIPVAMLTSRGAKKMKQRAAAEGAKGYFVKPYVDEVLLEAARKLINGEVLLKSEGE